jgi:protein-disulfide isomerase
MTQEAKILSIIAIITVLLLGGGLFFLTRNQPQTQTNSQGETVYQIDYTKGEKIGSDSAKVKVVEFGDLQCPACKAAEPTVEKMLNAHKADPKFQFIWRHFPLQMHQFAHEAANTAQEAAANGKFWEMHDKLYQTQDEWAALKDVPAVENYFVNLGQNLGIDPQKIKDAVEKRPYENVIQADISEGNNIGITGTPTFFLNGKKVTIVNSYDELSSQVDSALK